MKFLKNNFFVISLFIVFLLTDMALSYINPVGTLPYFEKNDFEKTLVKYPQREYNNVFFGNSVLISAFIPEISQTDYVELGLVYGKLTDLEAMLKKKEITVKENLVIAINYFALMDVLETNKTYIWHRNVFEPYAYFQRDRLHSLAIKGINNLLVGKPFANKNISDKKALSYGALTDAELDERLKVHKEKYWGLSEDAFSQNLKSLTWLIDYCKANDIRLRAVILPLNDYVAKPEISNKVINLTLDILNKSKIETLNWEDSFTRECFYDFGHLNYEIGAKYFTKEIDQWLKK